jgi:hypothetical protein
MSIKAARVTRRVVGLQPPTAINDRRLKANYRNGRSDPRMLRKMPPSGTRLRQARSGDGDDRGNLASDPNARRAQP